jgi:hypothetical protein
MTTATYRIGGSQPSSACVRHPGVPVSFQCTECLDSLCEGCRGGRERCCRLCLEAIARRAAGGPPPVVVRPPGSRWRVAIGVLAVLNAALGATWGVSFLLPQPTSPVVERSVADVRALSHAVEASRDAAGLVPADVEAVLGRVAADVADRVRSGAIRYHPWPDRRGFELTAVLGPRSAGRPGDR